MRDNNLTAHCAENAQKKSGRPTQPGNRSTASNTPKKGGKAKSIIHRLVRFFKRLNWKGHLLLAALMLVMFLPLMFIFAGGREAKEITSENAVHEYIFRNVDGTPVDIQRLTSTWVTVVGTEKRYDLTDAERWEIASVITAEAEGEPYAGKVAVAQCILQACEDEELRPSEVLETYGYAKSRPEPTEEALEAVQAVFDFGHVATNEPIKYFYAPALCRSDWHESQIYVMTINGHKFFKEID